MPPKQKKQNKNKKQVMKKKVKRGIPKQLLNANFGISPSFANQGFGYSTNRGYKLNAAINAITSASGVPRVAKQRKQWEASNQNQYFSSVIYPEGGRGSRIPTQFPIATATFHDVTRFTVTSNASGVCSWVIYPTPGPAFAYEHRDPLFDPAVGPDLTGAGATTINYKPAVLLSVSPNPICYQYRTVSMSAVFEGTQAALDNSGQITTCLLQTPMIDDTNAGLTYIQKQLFSKIQPVSGGQARVVYVPRDPLDSQFSDLAGRALLTGNYTTYFVMSFIGCKPSSTIGTITLYSNFEFVPSKSYMGITPVATSQDNPDQVRKTINAIDSNPQLATGKSSTAMKAVKIGSKLLSNQIGVDVMGGLSTLFDE